MTRYDTLGRSECGIVRRIRPDHWTSETMTQPSGLSHEARARCRRFWRGSFVISCAVGYRVAVAQPSGAAASSSRRVSHSSRPTATHPVDPGRLFDSPIGPMQVAVACRTRAAPTGRRRAARTDRVPSAPSTRPPHHGRAHFGEQEHHDRPAGGDGQARVQWGRAEPVVRERRVGGSVRQDHCLRLMTGLGSWPPKRSDLSGVVRALIEMIRGAVGPPSDRSGGGRQHAGKG